MGVSCLRPIQHRLAGNFPGELGTREWVGLPRFCGKCCRGGHFARARRLQASANPGGERMKDEGELGARSFPGSRPTRQAVLLRQECKWRGPIPTDFMQNPLGRGAFLRQPLKRRAVRRPSNVKR